MHPLPGISVCVIAVALVASRPATSAANIPDAGGPDPVCVTLCRGVPTVLDARFVAPAPASDGFVGLDVDAIYGDAAGLTTGTQLLQAPAGVFATDDAGQPFIVLIERPTGAPVVLDAVPRDLVTSCSLDGTFADLAARMLSPYCTAEFAALPWPPAAGAGDEASGCQARGGRGALGAVALLALALGTRRRRAR